MLTALLWTQEFPAWIFTPDGLQPDYRKVETLEIYLLFLSSCSACVNSLVCLITLSDHKRTFPGIPNGGYSQLAPDDQSCLSKSFFG